MSSFEIKGPVDLSEFLGYFLGRLLLILDIVDDASGHLINFHFLIIVDSQVVYIRDLYIRSFGKLVWTT
jgi:hypothetical protein